MRHLATICFLSTTLIAYATGSAQSIAYPINTTSLTASASYEQVNNPAGRGNCPASSTVDGIIAGDVKDPSTFTFDGWAVHPFGSQDQDILWVFNGGPRTVDAMQLLFTYSYLPLPHYVRCFEVYATTSANPSRSSAFFRVPVLSATVGQSRTAINGNRVDIDAPYGADYRIALQPVAVTGIKVVIPGRCGTQAEFNFYLSEVSFREVKTPGAFVPYGVGCAGSVGVPVLSSAAGQAPVAGQPFSTIVSPIPNNAPGVLLFGGLPSSLDLGTLGFVGCTWYTGNYIATMPMTSNGNQAFHTLLVPGSLTGWTYYNQAAVFDTGANGGLIFTNGAAATIGDC